MIHVKKVFSTVKQESRSLYILSIFSLILGVICIGGLIVDSRTLFGVNVWLKPFKFSISIAIYLLTIGVLSSIYPYSKRKKKIINGTVAWTNFVELVLIIIQGARGVQSHYNMSTPEDSLIYASMGILVTINVLIMMVFIFDTVRLKLAVTKPIQWAILLGWLTLFFGCWVGGQMISQLSHNVGIADGGDGLPLVNWSTVAGDLRVAHFFGMHAIQVIPLFAIFLHNIWTTSSRNKIIAVTLFGLTYAAWIGLLFYQAKQGMPLIHV